MVKMIFHGKNIHFYTITDMCQHFNKSRPYIKKTLNDIAELKHSIELQENHKN